MTLPRWIAPGAIAFLAIWLLLMAAGNTTMLRDPGTFWHTHTGERILKEGFFRTDPYTFTHPAFADRWWISAQWLGEMGMVALHRISGFNGEFLGAVTLLAATFAWLTVRLLRTGLHPVAVGTLVSLALAAAGSHFHVRPHLGTITGMAFTAAMLTDCDMGRFRLRQLFWLVPAFVIWVNVHGGYLGGFGSVVIVGSGWVVAWWLKRPTPVESWRDVGLLAVLFVCCGAAAFVNPYGTDMLRIWRVIMDEPLLRQIIQEHRPFEFDEPYAMPAIAFAAVYLFLLAGLNWRDIRVSWLLPIVWMLQTVGRCRHVSLFVVVGLVAIAAMWPHTRWAKWLAANRPDFYEPSAAPGPRPWWASVWLPTLVVLLTLGLQAGGVRVPVFGASWAVHTEPHWPMDVLDALKEHEPRPGDPHNKIFNDYIDGAFVIYHAPGYRVFVDDRCEVFGGQWLYDFVLASHPEKTSPDKRAATMAKWQSDYGNFDFALTRTVSPFDDYFKARPEWECVKRTENSALYRRK
jgi:hypothetical protein